jgi:ankyrin repeat protein
MSNELLFYAVAQGDVDQCVALLTEGGAEVDTRAKTGDTPLHFAVQKNFLSLVDLLISYGADLNAANEHACGQQTALHVACRNGQTKVSNVLR